MDLLINKVIVIGEGIVNFERLEDIEAIIYCDSADWM